MPIAEDTERAVTRREFKFHSVEESNDGRWYIVDGLQLMSVTTAFGATDKKNLIDAAALRTARFAFTQLPMLVAASRRKPCERSWARCSHGPEVFCDGCPCGECPECAARWLSREHKRHAARRADEGTRAHDVAEWWSYHGQIKDHDQDIAPYVATFQQFVTDYGVRPEDVLLAEALVIHREIGAAGTTDGIIRIHAERTEKAAKLVSRLLGVSWKKAQRLRLTVDVIIDWKTREKEDPQLYPTMALQLAGYRHFPVVRIKGTDIEEPMPAVDGGLIIQLRPGGYTARPVVCDEFTYEHGFLPTLRSYQWFTEHGAASVSSHTFVLPETVAARARKAAREQVPDPTSVPAA